MTQKRTVLALLSATALNAGSLSPIFAQDIDSCGALINGAIHPDCVQLNAGDVVDMPTGAQTEPEVRPRTNASGFAISVDGDVVDSDPTLEDRVRKIDLALEEANVQVTFDGFDPETRLAVEMADGTRGYGAGETVTLQSETNYPAFVARGEFRIIDRAGLGGERLISVVPVDANGRAAVTVPAGEDIVVVHRVYDANGRYDETAPLPLGVADDRALRADREELADTATVRNIPIRGGTVTVLAENVQPGSSLSALGTTARPDASGAVVIQRILPPGDYDVDVSITGGQNTRISRPIDIPASEWFFFGVADVTWEQFDRGGEDSSRTLGRIQAYVDGQTADGVEITGSLDTGEEELEDIFRRLDEKDPRSVLDRIDPEDTYPTFGDDSEIRDNTPTSGRIYLKIEKDGSHVLWGDYQATVDGGHYLRNERTLYGAQIVGRTPETTANGDARVAVDLYASQPDQLVGRETFRGTGGSVYFLRRQDVTPGTETLTIQVRDSATNRVLETRRLVPGRDYAINYLQGVITLTSPLSDGGNGNLIQTVVGGDQIVNLVTQYEYTPTAADVDGYSYGGRVEGWANDRLRFGLTATSDDTGLDGVGGADQKAYSADIRYQFSPNSFVQLDFAHSDGPGFDQDFSIDGGLTIDGVAAQDGTGSAVRLAGQADLRDLGSNREGVVGGYFEQREEGFSTLDYQVTDATGDETLFGFYTRVTPTDTQFGWGLYADVYENDAGTDRTEFGAEIEGTLAPRLRFAVGLEYLDETTATTSGTRLDAAARLEFDATPRVTYALFGQGTVNDDGLDDYDRLGFGVSARLTDNWSLDAEVSEGTGGAGGRLLASYADEDGHSRYFGYELDTDRALDAGVPSRDNGGKYIVGGRSRLSEAVTLFGENVYDIFDEDRTLTSAYGIEYARSQFLTYDASLEFGQIDSDGNDSLDRFAFGFGTRYDDDILRASARVEYRQDDAETGALYNDVDALYFDADARYKISEERRLVFGLAAADVRNGGGSVLDGQVIDVNTGYAFRPIYDERFNMLARYRYLKDTFGQTIDGVAGAGARQESHVFSFEGSYDLNRQWTLGAKVGGRFAQTSSGVGDPWVDNDAYLGVINARFHVVHNWDILLEARHLSLVDADLAETGILGAVYRHVGNNAKIGVGYNFATFSDDLTDLERDDEGMFVNLNVKF